MIQASPGHRELGPKSLYKASSTPIEYYITFPPLTHRHLSTKYISVLEGPPETTMADSEAQMFQVQIEVLVVEDFQFAETTGSNVEDVRRMTMEESLWSQTPDDLLKTILLFLPAASQARFQSVCKQWRIHITSAAFQEKSSLIACKLGYPFRILGLPIESARAQCRHQIAIPRPLKVRTVEFPGLMLPERICYKETRLSSHGDLLALAWKDGHSNDLRCWLLNLQGKTWQELPPLVMPDLVMWNLWLLGSGKGSSSNNTFKVTAFVWTLAGISLQTYSSAHTHWQKFALPREFMYGISLEKCRFTKRGYVICDVLNRLWRQEGNTLTVLPNPPSSAFTLLSDVYSNMDALFGYEFLYGAFTLYKLEEGRNGAQWRCVVYRLPLRAPAILKAKIVGDMLLMLVCVTTVRSSIDHPTTFSDDLNIVGYNIRENSCKQLKLPPAAWDFFARNQVSLIVAPTTSQLGL